MLTSARRLLVAALLAGMAISPDASAAYLTGNELSEMCQAPAGSAKWVNCLGYLEGSADAFELPRRLIASGQSSDDPHNQVCIPGGVTAGQLIAIVRNYFQAHPEDLHWSANLLVWNALIEKYRCP